MLKITVETFLADWSAGSPRLSLEAAPSVSLFIDALASGFSSENNSEQLSLFSCCLNIAKTRDLCRGLPGVRHGHAHGKHVTQQFQESSQSFTRVLTDNTFQGLNLISIVLSVFEITGDPFDDNEKQHEFHKNLAQDCTKYGNCVL